MTKIDIILLVLWVLKIIQWVITFSCYTDLSDFEKRFATFKIGWSDNLIWAIPLYLWL